MAVTQLTIPLPTRIDRLDELAANVWWSWNEPARALFQRIDPVTWETCDDNPVLFLGRVERERLERAAGDPEYVGAYDAVLAAFDAVRHPAAGSTWVERNAPRIARKTVAYFSAEFGVHRALPIYSGGLGVLAGDHTKSASDLGLPLVGVSLLYRQGYLRQRLTADGWQQDVPANLAPWEEPTERMVDAQGQPCSVEVVFDQPDAPLKLNIWKVRVGRVPIFLLDADVEGNPDWTRDIASRLYGGDKEHRLRQEIILGIGGVRALRTMKIDPAYWHANEGHAAFHLLERIREHVAAGLSFEQAAARVRRSTVFTSHTPVPAGHDVFEPWLMDRYFGHYWPELGLDRDQFLALGHHGDEEHLFNLTALSMRLAEGRNGVSKRHGEITRMMWAGLWPDNEPSEVPITSITNGIHLPTWISPRVQSMLDRHLPSDWRERQHLPETWEPVSAIPDDEVWSVRVANKVDLFEGLRTRTRRRWHDGGFDPRQVVVAGPFLEESVLTLGFARRFATYKRATLLFHDAERLARILNNPERPVQIVFAGKAHPADEDGKRLIQEIYGWALDPRFNGRICFVEDYDMGIAALLVAGVDVWLNNPRAPLEASGTSGMKAAVNGVPNLSILDGWWSEGWRADNSNGWGIAPAQMDDASQDAAEASLIYDAIENEVAPRFYDRGPGGLPAAWVDTARQAIRTVAPAFSSQRMLIDYIERLYTPAAQG